MVSKCAAFYTGTYSGTVWNVQHDKESLDVIVQCLDNSSPKKVISPLDIEYTDSDNIKITWFLSTTGKVLVEKRDSDRLYTETISSASSTWVIDHNLGSRALQIEVLDNSSPRKVITPKKIEATTLNRVTVTFNQPTAGKIIIFK